MPKPAVSNILKTAEHAIRHIQSGNARIRLLSYASNNAYRYHIRESQTGKVFFVYLIAVSGDLGYMGSIINGEFKRTDKSKVADTAPAFRAFDWVWRNLCQNRMPVQTVIEAL